jgi:hypothetical protein
MVSGPDVVHSWEAIGDTLVLSVRFPSVEVGEPARPVSGVIKYTLHENFRDDEPVATGRSMRQ